MAPPASLTDIGREAFDLLEKTYGHRRRTNFAPPPQHKARPCVYYPTEAPLIAERLPEAVASHPSHQYQQTDYLSSHRSEFPLHHHSNHHRHHNFYAPVEGDVDAYAMDSNKAAVLYRATKIVEYRRV